MFILRPALPHEVDACTRILDDGRRLQRAQGFVQWVDAYPGREDVESDLARGTAHVVVATEDEDGACAVGGGATASESAPIAAYLSLDPEGEPAYEAIDGAWLSDAPYLTIHRLAVSAAFRGQGVGRATLRLVDELCRERFPHLGSVRVDTHADNLSMRRLLTEAGYVCCGEVEMHGTRLAHEHLLARADDGTSDTVGPAGAAAPAARPAAPDGAVTPV